MKRAWAVLLAAAMLAGCRTAEPTTNPFLRTTVPPPATTPGVVVTPGTPYAQGISPPMVTTPAPAVTTPAPVITQPVPVAPAPAPVAPMPMMQQGDRFKPPGGNFLFHQSSYESPSRDASSLASAWAPQDRVIVQACYAPPSDHPQTVMSADGFIINPYVVRPQKIENPHAISRDGYIENPYVKPKPVLPAEPPAESLAPAEQRPSLAAPQPERSPLPRRQPAERRPPAPVAKAPQRLPARAPVARLSADPPPTLPSKVSVSTPGDGSVLRILGESSSDDTLAAKRTPQAPAPPAAEPTVLRITAGSAQPALRSLAGGELPRADGVTLAIQPDTSSETTASVHLADPGEHAVVRAAFEPAGGKAASPYGYSHDYRRLRGRLEYSHSQRQWKLRYIPIDGQTDAYGGSVVLPTSPAVERFRPGDFVQVEGTLLRDALSPASFAPRYQPTFIERAAP